MPDLKENADPPIPDGAAQANVQVVAEAPAIALGTIYQSLAHATGLQFMNAVAAQQQATMLQQASTTQGIIQLYSVDTLSDETAASGLAESLARILKTNGQTKAGR